MYHNADKYVILNNVSHYICILLINSTDTSAKDGITLEMICERESEPEEDDDVEEIDNDEYTLEATNMPPDFSQILDHLSIFKRKPSAIKAIGDNSVFTEDKACQAYDVPWRDYEKCIGYSLVTKSEYNPETKEEMLVPVAMPDENFGKYQEQFLFYLQHIEDHGIETDETKVSFGAYLFLFYFCRLF